MIRTKGQITTRLTLLILPLLMVGGLIFLLRPVVATGAPTATLTVDTTADNANDGSCSDGDCSLRDALASASDGDTITFAAPLSDDTITLGGTQLTIDKSVTISATTPISVSANGQSRVFEIANNATVTLHGLTIRDGNAGAGEGGDGGGIYVGDGTTLALSHSMVVNNVADDGGGIYNAGGTTIVSNSTLSGNGALGFFGGGGGIYNAGGTTIVSNSTLSGNRASSFFGGGGGIYSEGTTIVSNSTLFGNSTGERSNGGGIYNAGGTTSVSNSTLSFNSTGINGYGSGGGIYNAGGTTIVSNSTLSANSAGAYGNGGGGIYNTGGTTSVSNSIIHGYDFRNCGGTVTSAGHNLANDSSCGLSATGDLPNTDPLLGALADNGGDTQTHALLSGSPAFDAGGATCGVDTDQRGMLRPRAGVCDIGAFEGVNLIVSTLVDEEDGDFSDGDNSLREAIANAIDGETITFAAPLSGDTITLGGTQLTIDKSVTISATIPISVSANSQSRIFEIANNANVTLHGLTIRDGNLLSNECSGFDFKCGGGIFVGSGTALTLTHSTVISNSADFGSGIFNEGGTTTVSNSTLSANSADSDGGGIYNLGTTTVTNSTLSGNSADSDGGGIHNLGGTASVSNSTLSTNSAANSGGGIFNDSGTVTVNNSIIANSMSGGDCSGTVTSVGHNLASDGSCNLNGTGDLPNTNPLLGALADNGGDTKTLQPANNSPAIDGAGATCGVTVDQRGEPRDDLRCDIGAFELIFNDSATVIEDAVDAGETAFFGPTLTKIERTGGADPGTITVTKQLVETEDDEAFDIIWSVNADTSTGLNLNVTFCYKESEIPPMIAAQEANFVIYRQPSGGGAFSPLATTVDELNNCVTAPVTGFSNFGIGLAAPTAVVLEFFAATANTDGSVTVEWETASEVNHAGFNIYRRPINSRDAWAQVNDQLIASRGSQAQGAIYQFVEPAVAAGEWEYLLEDVETDGKTYRHTDATDSVTITTPTAVHLTTNRTAVGSALTLLAQVGGLLLLTAGAVVGNIRQRHNENAPNDKPAYAAPTVTSYSTQALQQQLGPARAFSPDSPSPDADIFGEGF